MSLCYLLFLFHDCHIFGRTGSRNIHHSCIDTSRSSCWKNLKYSICLMVKWLYRSHNLYCSKHQSNHHHTCSYWQHYYHHCHHVHHSPIHIQHQQNFDHNYIYHLIQNFYHHLYWNNILCRYMHGKFCYYRAIEQRLYHYINFYIQDPIHIQNTSMKVCIFYYYLHYHYIVLNKYLFLSYWGKK